MGSTGFAPGTGTHSWCIRLDRCEKGHVFLGVATAEASTRTYVGGDKHGWGMIGTKALWHNRSKVRGDYGEGYGSRCTVRLTLDTEKGTLALGLAGGREGGLGGGGADWGVAFEKLPREVLYPAVGLYQREDQVTLLPAVAVGAGAGAVGGGGVGEGVLRLNRPPLLGVRGVRGVRRLRRLHHEPRFHPALIHLGSLLRPGSMETTESREAEEKGEAVARRLRRAVRKFRLACKVESAEE